MERIIAVEDGLKSVKEYLQKKGYNVVSMGANKNADAAVITGMDSNMMGMETIQTDGPVISAQGRSPEDILRELESKWRH